jgi:hypothetical protein
VFDFRSQREIKGSWFSDCLYLKRGATFMMEQLKTLEERLSLVEQEYNLARERHEFLAQHDLYDELIQLKRMRRELRSNLHQQ